MPGCFFADAVLRKCASLMLMAIISHAADDADDAAADACFSLHLMPSLNTPPADTLPL